MGDAKESYTSGASGWDTYLGIYPIMIALAEEVCFLVGRVSRVPSRRCLQEEAFRQLAEVVRVEA